MRVEPLNLERRDEIVLANIWIDKDYVDHIGGQRFVFQPLRLFRTEKSDGNLLLERAERHYRNRIEQAEGERNMWARKISSLNQRERDMALRFCDAEGNPNTKPWPCPALVNVSTEAGRKIYDEATKRAKEAGIKVEYIKTVADPKWVHMPDNSPDVDAGSIAQGESRRFERQAFEASEEVPPRAPASAVAQVEGEGEEEAPAAKLPVRIRKPTPTWSNEELAKYSQSKGFTISRLDMKNEQKLLEIALRAHADHAKRMTAAGVQYEEV